MDSRRSEVGGTHNLKLVHPGGALEDAASAPVRSKRLIANWEIQLDTWPRKILAIVVILGISATLIYQTWWVFLAAWITRNKVIDPAIYERAVRYDPRNADYHFVLAEIYNNSTQYLNLNRAREEYEAAVQYNPYRSEHWVALSKFYEQEGNIERSRYAMTKALENDPNYAMRHWAAANLYVRLGDQKAADYELRRSADLDVSYTIQVLDLVWALYANADVIMSTHIPNTKQANLIALNYFIGHQSPRGAELAWNRLKSFETKTQERFGYVDYLITLNKPKDAWDVFTVGLAEKGSARAGSPPFFNADFDQELINGGFDWRYTTSDDAEVRRDTTTVKSGMASLLVTFSGKQNPNYGDIWHYVPLEKGRNYVLKFWMKTDSISTNEGMYVTVDGKSSEKQVGTTYWQDFSIPFTATSDLVRVTLRRDTSKKLDNLLKGKVWLDGFSVTALP
jgi:hypothetical protein